MPASNEQILPATGRSGLAEISPADFKEVCSVQTLVGKDAWANPILNARFCLRSLDRTAGFDVKGH